MSIARKPRPEPRVRRPRLGSTRTDVVEGRAGGLTYVELFRSAPLDRIRIVKTGLPAAEAKALLAELNIPSDLLLQSLQVSVSTLNRRAKNAERLPTDEGERILGLAKLVGQVEALVEESGDPRGFEAADWTARWLTEPAPALGGVKPIELMDTMEGQALVSDTLARVQSGAYA